MIRLTFVLVLLMGFSFDSAVFADTQQNDTFGERLSTQETTREASTSPTITLDLSTTSISQIGQPIACYIKFGLLSSIGYPIPNFFLNAFTGECPNVATSTPGGEFVFLTLIKNTTLGDGAFSFTFNGAQSGTTSVNTFNGSGSINLGPWRISSH